MSPEIGDRIRTLRKEQNMTLTDMAEKTELSLGYLSNLEQNKTSPTIANLHKICNALTITLNDILIPGSVEQNVVVVRADSRKTLFEQDNGTLRYESLTVGNTDVKVTCMIISGDQLFSFSLHDHDEFGIVLEGVLELHIEDKNYFFYPGDSIYIKAHTMHSGKRGSKETCTSYWIKKA